MIIYKNYDQAALDDQYNNQTKVPDFAKFVEQWQQESDLLRQQIHHHSALAYGPHEREYLDIFPAPQPAAPVHVFFHGGYWRALQASDFHFVARNFIEQGITTILVNYPLAPAATMDEIVAACRRAMGWIYRKVADYGGDPKQITISGHSAGGHLVAMMLATDWPSLAADLPPDLVKGGCAISGLFNLIPIQQCYVNDSLGMDEATARRNSPVNLTPSSDAPLIISLGGAESAEYHAQSQELAEVWAGQGGSLTEIVVTEANHFTVLEALVQPDGVLKQAILGQVRG